MIVNSELFNEQIRPLVSSHFFIKIPQMFNPVATASCIHFCPQPTNSDSGELFSMKLFVYMDGW